MNSWTQLKTWIVAWMGSANTMYRSYDAVQWRTYLNLPVDYTVDSVLLFGSNEQYPYRVLEDALRSTGVVYELRRLEGEYLLPIAEIAVDGKTIWFFTSYGGAQLSEYLHLACSFGSKQNILLGNCGGLMSGVEAYDLIIPTCNYATESSATTYQPDVNNQFMSDAQLSGSLTALLSSQHIVHREKMITCQAMFGESNELVRQWADDGYGGVEMEAATVFAVSNYFNVPAAAVLKVIDNLAKGETIVENGYQSAEKTHESVLNDMFAAALRQLVH